MPYIIRKEGAKYAVRKKLTGKLVGKTDSHSKALAMVRAIYYNEHKGKG